MEIKDIIKQIEADKLMVVMREIGCDRLESTVSALIAGGIRFVEVAFDATGCTAASDTAKQIELLRTRFGGVLHVGAGTVLSCDNTRLAYSAGAEYIVSPDTNSEVIKMTKTLGMISIAGAMTPTEIQHAHCVGADFVKIFPAGTLGVKYIKTIRVPLAHIRMIGFGGIAAADIPEYLDAGLCGFGISSGILRREYIEAGKYESITKLALTYADAVKQHLCGKQS